MSCFGQVKYWIMDHMDTETKIDWGFISISEGSSNQGYVPCDGKGGVIGNSGCTIGCGFDIGQQTASSLVAYSFSSDLYRSLLPYVDRQGELAKQFVTKYPLFLSTEEVQEVNDKVHSKFCDDLTELFNSNSELKFQDLDARKQTTIADVAYQYGNLKIKCPNFFHAIVNGYWREAVEELRMFGDSYPSRRLREAALLESSLDKS